MQRFITLVYNTDRYHSDSERLKAYFIYTVLTMMMILVTMLLILASSGEDVTRSITIGIIILVVNLTSYGLIYRGYRTTASWLFVVAVFVAVTANNFLSGILLPQNMMGYVIVYVIAGFLLERNGLLLIIPSLLAIIALVPDVAADEGANLLTTRISLAIMIIALGGIIYFYNSILHVARKEGVDEEALERFKLADVNMRIIQHASERKSLDEAMNSTLDLILENYSDLYHAQVFLIGDDGIQARLVASSGEIGKRLLEKGHSLAVGSLSVIGQATLKGEVLVARAGLQDSIHRQNILLAETTLEAAFPLSVAGKIIGALDLQSRILRELSASDSLTFQSLANSLALAIDNIRQFDAAKARVLDNQRLAEQTRSALRDVERMNQRLIGRAWSEYVSGKGSDFGLTVDFDSDTVTKDSTWTTTLMNAVDIKNIVKDGNIIAVPLTVRGQVIGAMEFELAESQEFSPEDLDLIQEVSDRFGLAAENTRLVEESQRIAQRETLVNEITSRFQSAQNVEATLAEAARSLSDTLEAKRVMIRLGTPNKNANGS